MSVLLVKAGTKSIDKRYYFSICSRRNIRKGADSAATYKLTLPSGSDIAEKPTLTLW